MKTRLHVRATVANTSSALNLKETNSKLTSDDLSTSTLSILGSLDDSWQIENLDRSSVYSHRSRYPENGFHENLRRRRFWGYHSRRQCREFIVGSNRDRSSESRHERRLSNGRESTVESTKNELPVLHLREYTHMNPTLAIPVLATSNPTPAPPPPVVGVKSSRLSIANFALSLPK